LLRQEERMAFKKLTAILKEGYALILKLDDITPIKEAIIFVEKEIEPVEKALLLLNNYKTEDRINQYVQSLNLKYDISEEIVEY